jgi:hypothetical protein
MLPLPVMETDLATGEGRKKMCPHLAVSPPGAYFDPWYVVYAICGCAEL